ISGREIVENRDVVALVEKRRHEVAPDRAGAAGDEIASDRRMLATTVAGYSRSVSRRRVLLVILADALSQLIAKGEVVEGYYNPGGLFTDVHLPLTNNDRPRVEDVQPMVGKARLQIHNLPLPSLRNTLGWQPRLISAWTQRAVDLAREVSPDLVRTINNFV